MFRGLFLTRLDGTLFSNNLSHLNSRIILGTYANLIRSTFMSKTSQGGSGPPFDIRSLINERSFLSVEKSTYNMSEYTGDPNVAAKSVLTALAGLTAALSATMVAEPAGSTDFQLRGSPQASEHPLNSMLKEAVATALTVGPVVLPMAGTVAKAALSCAKRRTSLQDSSTVYEQPTVDTSKLPQDDMHLPVSPILEEHEYLSSSQLAEQMHQHFTLSPTHSTQAAALGPTATN